MLILWSQKKSNVLCISDDIFNSRNLNHSNCIYFGWNAATTTLKNKQQNSTDNKNMNIVLFSIFSLWSILKSTASQIAPEEII